MVAVAGGIPLILMPLVEPSAQRGARPVFLTRPGGTLRTLLGRTRKSEIGDYDPPECVITMPESVMRKGAIRLGPEPPMSRRPPPERKRAADHGYS
jgi:hypothetical protein